MPQFYFQSPKQKLWFLVNFDSPKPITVIRTLRHILNPKNKQNKLTFWHSLSPSIPDFLTFTLSAFNSVEGLKESLVAKPAFVSRVGLEGRKILCGDNCKCRDIFLWKTKRNVRYNLWGLVTRWGKGGGGGEFANNCRCNVSSHVHVTRFEWRFAEGSTNCVSYVRITIRSSYIIHSYITIPWAMHVIFSQTSLEMPAGLFYARYSEFLR